MTIVAAIPRDFALPVNAQGGVHATLAYFGDSDLNDDDFTSLCEIVRHISENWSGDTRTKVIGTDWFGEDQDVFVLRLADAPNDILCRVRHDLLEMLPESLLDTFTKAQTHPTFNPHITLDEQPEADGYNPESRGQSYPLFVDFGSLAVWNEDAQYDFPLGDPDEEYGIDIIQHYGTPRHSGRYPWGSGDNAQQRTTDFLGMVDELSKQGLSEAALAKALGLSSTTQLRAQKAIAKNERRKENAARAAQLKEKGYSNTKIGEMLGVNESVVRSLLKPMAAAKASVITNTADMLKSNVDKLGYIDVGIGVERHIGISKEKLAAAVAALEEQGYSVVKVQVPQVGTNQKTTIKVLAPPGTTYRDIVTDPSKIKSIVNYSNDNGETFPEINPPVSISSKRLAVRYGPDGGSEMDGVILVRPGVEDLTLGKSRYAQVRIAIDDSHYLKGMAMYSDDIPAGKDLLFNTNKKNTGNTLDALKELKDDPENPFGSTIRQFDYISKDGSKHQSPMNLVNEEGSWGEWSRNLSSQMASKQTPAFAKKQLQLAYERKLSEYEEINSLTNPAVKRRLLQSFADDCDSDAVHLKAAAMPRQRTQVILPVPGLKDTEVYAPNFKNGEEVVLIRYPHGGIFEIPRLTVNNRNPEGRKTIGTDPIDAIGISSKVAERLSGADFDGDTVVVIPDSRRQIKTSAPLAGLKDFDPKARYAPYDGMKTVDGGIYNAKTRHVDYGSKEPNKAAKQTKMGEVSNLITDMTIKGATETELARAVRHSMVVIDSEKHHLNEKQSYIDNDIRELKKKYQGSARGGADTLISKASGKIDIPTRKMSYKIDPETGKKIWTPKNESYINKKGKTIVVTQESTRMAETDDARTLISKANKPMENVYATHANKLKALGNQARKSYISTKPSEWSPSAKATYSNEVSSLKAKLNTALKNAPLERKAQVLANTRVKIKTQANPGMTSDEKKKLAYQSLTQARAQVGAKKQLIKITPKEWEAIQAGAVSNNMLDSILSNTDLDVVKKLATPRENTVMTSSKQARARSLLASGATPSEVADALGVPLSTLTSSMKPTD